jgi:hypothetical protein
MESIGESVVVAEDGVKSSSPPCEALACSQSGEVLA